MQRYHSLTPFEKSIIENKGTERPGSGQYEDFKEKGVYLCKRCDLPLYLSSCKFSSYCGWPSFDEEISNHVKRMPDKDGRRVEILCSRCLAHLGHVFENEGFTSKNLRHCVNSASLYFNPAYVNGYPRAIIGGGCFWGIEYLFKKKEGILQTQVGYIGGTVVNPTYKEVCSGQTGHIEVIDVIFDDRFISYEELLAYFFNIHDPTQLLRQGPDKGYQYQSVICYLTIKQKESALKMLHLLRSKGITPTTQVLPASFFYPAESDHQDYYNKTGKQPYCHTFVKRI